MHTRLAWTAPVVLAAALFAACGPGTSSPALGDTTAPPDGVATLPASMAPLTTGTADVMSTLCQTWATEVAPSWPPDQTTAARLAPMFSQWAQSPELATVGADLTAVSVWLNAQASGMTAPDAETTAAFTRIGTFVDANC